MKILLRALIATAVLAASPALADQVRFTGTTTANALLIKDTLHNVLLFAQASKKCEVMSAVEATVLPTDYEPKTPKYRVGQSPTTYESWTVTLCGERTRFLISFWPSPEGGTMFNVGYPYPADAP